MGDSLGNERKIDQFCHGSAGVRGKYPGFALYRQKGPWNEKIAGYEGKQGWFYQRAFPAGWGFTRVFAGPKVKGPAIPQGWRGRGYK